MTVAALILSVLAFPFALALTVLAPRLVSWWSTTSRWRLERRIAVLEANLEYVAHTWTFSPSTWVTYSAIFWTAFVATLTIELFVVLTVIHATTTLALITHLFPPGRDGSRIFRWLANC
jgi:hypothetical protein